MADYGTPVGDYDLRGDSLSDGASVSVFTENLGTGPIMTAPAGSAEGAYVAATKSLLFDGSDHYRAPDKAAWNFLHQGPSTVFLRVKTPAFISGNQSMLNTDQSTTGGLGFFLTGGRPRLYIHGGTLITYSLVTSMADAVSPDTWYTLGFSVGESTAQIYVDGVSKASASQISDFGAGDSRFVGEIGGYNGSQGWTGEIKRILAWSTAITDPAHLAEIHTELAS